MTKADTPSEVTRMSDEAVRAKTGYTWPEWFAILDTAGAQQMSHQQIVAYLHTQHGVGPWWQQMVTVTYEQARGMRAKHEMPDGYQIGGSKTIAVPLAALYDAWHNPAQRQQWLPDTPLLIRKETANKSMRLAWIDDSRVDVLFYAKGEAKSQVTVQHSKLGDAEAAEQMKAYWAGALERLKDVLEI